MFLISTSSLQSTRTHTHTQSSSFFTARLLSLSLLLISIHLWLRCYFRTRSTHPWPPTGLSSRDEEVQLQPPCHLSITEWGTRGVGVGWGVGVSPRPCGITARPTVRRRDERTPARREVHCAGLRAAALTVRPYLARCQFARRPFVIQVCVRLFSFRFSGSRQRAVSGKKKKNERTVYRSVSQQTEQLFMYLFLQHK